MKRCPQCGKTYEDRLAYCPDDSSQLVTATAANDPLLNRMLAGRYQMVEKIGEGGMGAIYKAIHTRMDRVCAIKLLTGLSADNQEAVGRFNREARMASRIDHPNAVTVFDFGEAENGLLYLAMEFIDGRPLSKLLLEEKVLPLERVVHITRQVGDALAAAHALGIVHRDLKPDNIMICRKGAENDYVKVLDFGIAKTTAEDAADNVTRTGYVLGTPIYMSPEQLSGEKLDGRSDIYSLAILVYQMLSGRLPFSGENAQAVMVKRLTSDPIPLLEAAPHLDAAVDQAVMLALRRNREERTPTVERFVADLEAAMRAGTQMLKGRDTSFIAGERPAGRETVAITELETDQAGHTQIAASQRDIRTSDATLAIGPPAAAPRTPPTEAASAPPPGFQAAAPAPLSVADSTPAPTLIDQAPFQAPDTRPMVESRARPGRRLLWAALGAVVLAALVIVYLLLPSPAGSFHLTLRGAPAGSEVFLNDVRRGVTDATGALTLEDLPPGPASLRVSREGFGDFTASLNGEAGASHEIEVKCLPAEIDYFGAMVLVPAGEFMMGSDGHDENEKPAHTAATPAFYIDKFEVTNAQYRAFCDATGRPYPKPVFDPDYFLDQPEAPVVGISWSDAAAYAQYINKRLPTEAEWEKAASWDWRKREKYEWPWGNGAGGGAPNIGRDRPAFAPVGTHASDRSPAGAFDMAGNAAEWVDGFYQPYAGNQTSDEDFGTTYRVVRGGSSIGGIDRARTTARGYQSWQDGAGEKSAWLIGFRCVVPADTAEIQPLLRAR